MINDLELLKKWLLNEQNKNTKQSEPNLIDRAVEKDTKMWVVLTPQLFSWGIKNAFYIFNIRAQVLHNYLDLFTKGVFVGGVFLQNQLHIFSLQQFLEIFYASLILRQSHLYS